MSPVPTWSRTASSSTKDGKSSHKSTGDKASTSATEDSGGGSRAETETLIRSIADAVTERNPAKPSEQINRLEGAMSQLVCLLFLFFTKSTVIVNLVRSNCRPGYSLFYLHLYFIKIIRSRHNKYINTVYED